MVMVCPTTLELNERDEMNEVCVKAAVAVDFLQ